MKNNTKNINQKMLETFEDDTAAHEFSEEQANGLQLIRQNFNGTFCLTFIVVVLIQLIFAGLAIYCAFVVFYGAKPFVSDT